MRNIFLLFAFLFFVFSFGQIKTEYTLIDKKIASIPEKNTTTTQEIANFIALGLVIYPVLKNVSMV